jgi:hypothetical protein
VPDVLRPLNLAPRPALVPPKPSTLDTIMQANLAGAEGRTPTVEPPSQGRKDAAFGVEAARRSLAAPVNVPVQGAGILADLLGRLDAAAGPATNPVTKAIGGAFDKVYKSVKDWSDDWDAYQKRSDNLARTFLTEAGGNPESRVAKDAELVGGTAAAGVKYGNPWGLAFLMAENGISKAHSAMKEDATPTQYLAAGTLSAATVAALQAVPGGDKAFKTLAGMIAARASRTAGEGVAWGTLDQLVDKLVMGKDMTKEKWEQGVVEATKQIAAMHVFGAAGMVREGQRTFRAGQVAKEYVSRDHAREAILGKVQDAYERMDDRRPEVREQAKKDATSAWRDLGTLDHIDKAGIAYKGKAEPVDVQKEVQAALKEMPGQRQFNRSDIQKRTLPTPEAPAAAAPSPQPEPTPAPEPAAPAIPVDQIRAGLPQLLQERFDLDMAPLNEKQAQAQADLERIQRDFDRVLQKAKGRAYSQKGKKVTDKDIQTVLRNDPKTVDELKDIHARHTYNQVQFDAINQAREAVADKWRKVTPEQNPQEAPRAAQEGQVEGSGVSEHPGTGVVGAPAEAGGGNRPVEGRQVQEKAPDFTEGLIFDTPQERSGQDRRQADQPVDVERRGAERRAQVRAAAAAERPADQLTHQEAIARVQELERDRLLDQRIPEMTNGLAFDRQYKEGDPVASLDVRGLKAANKHGQETGTEYLIHIGKTLHAQAKKAGLLAAHISGDEFRLTGGTQAQIDAAIAATNKALAKAPFTFTENGKEVRLTGELHSGTGTSPEKADQAMAAAKAARAAANLDPTPARQVPESLQDVPGLKVSGDVFTIPTASLHADPVRFQHKVQNETTGIQQVNSRTGATGSLHGVKAWNEQSAGVLDVWRDPADGKVYVVNGHNRYDKALDLGVQNLRVQFLDAKDAKDAMTQGAVKNLAEGNGTALDAAVYFRNAKTTPADLEAKGIPANKKVVQDGMALAGLPDSWFHAAANDPEILRLAIETGKAGLKGKQTETAFKELHDLIAKKGSAEDISTPYWKEMVDRIKGTRDVATGQTNLFGEEETTSTLAEQTDLIRHIQGKLAADKQAGTVLTGKRYSEAVGKAATVDTKGAGELKQESASALGYFKAQKNLTGIGDIINDYAARLQQAKSAKDADAIRAEAFEMVRKEIRSAHAGTGRESETVPGGGGEGPGLFGGDGSADFGGTEGEVATAPEPAKANAKAPEPATEKPAPKLRTVRTKAEPKPKAELSPEQKAMKDTRVREKARIGELFPGDQDKSLRKWLYTQRAHYAHLEDATLQRMAEQYRAAQKPKTDAELDQALAQQGAQTPESVAQDVEEAGKVGRQTGAIIVPPGRAGQGLLARAAKRAITGAVHAISEGISPFRHLGDNAFKNLAQALDGNNQLQHLDAGTGGLAEQADSMIDPTLPKPKGDLKSGTVGQYGRSPHQIEGQVHEPGEGIVIDQSLAANDRVMKQAAGTQWAVRTLRGVKDASKVVQKVMTPVSQNIFRVSRQLDPLERQAEALDKALKQATERAATRIANESEAKGIDRALKSGQAGDRSKGLKRGTEEALLNAMGMAGNDPSVVKARELKAKWDAKNRGTMKRLQDELKGHYTNADARIQELAKKYQDVRVSLLAELPADGAPPEWLEKIATKQDMEVAGQIREGMDKYREALKKRGIPVLEDPYITHLLKPLDTQRFSTPEGRLQIKQVLSFHHRNGNMNLFPTAHGSLSYYIPTVARKLAYQPVLNKWGKNPYLTEGGDYYAPKYGAWLNERLRDMEYPKEPPVYAPILQAAKQFEILKTIAFSPRVAVKHAIKTANLLGYHHTWLLPAMKDMAVNYAQDAANAPLIQKAVKALGGTPRDQSLTQVLAANLMATKQISRMLREDPMVAEYERGTLDRPVTKLAGKIGTLAGYPVTAVEAFENGLNMMASVRRGAAAGFDANKQIRATMLSILDYNYRGGADAAKYLKDPVANAGIMFTMTPAKGLEIQAKILAQGLKGEKDVFGSDETAHLIRHVVALGAIGLIGKKYGHDLFKMMFHPPLVNAHWAANMTKGMFHYFFTPDKMQGKREVAAAVGDWRGAATSSPVLGISADIYALAASLMKGSASPLLSSVSSIKQAKILTGQEKPRGYADAAHYLTDSPTPAEERRREAQAVRKGLPTVQRLLSK